MALYTPNYNLKKPAQSDFYNVDDFNGNADILDVKLKEIEHKKADKIPNVTTADITYYVNTSTGSDLSDGLTLESAFKTIMKAVNLIPKEVNHAVTIQIANGIYAEYIIVKDFKGTGQIFLHVSTVEEGHVYIKGIQCISNSIYIQIGDSFNVTPSGNYENIKIIDCSFVELWGIYDTNNEPAKTGIIVSNSTVKMYDSKINNKSVGIKIFNGSSVSCLIDTGFFELKGCDIGASITDDSVFNSDADFTGTTIPINYQVSTLAILADQKFLNLRGCRYLG